MNHPVFGYHIVKVLKLYRTQLRDDFMIFYVISFTISLLSSIGQKKHERQNECYNTHTRTKLIYNQYNPNLIVRLWGVRSYLANHNYTTIRQFRTFMYAMW